MSELIKATLSRLRLAWRQVLAVHLVYTGLGIILFAPLLGVLGQALLKLSGKPVLADMDLLFFALSPAGAFAFGLFAAVIIVVSAFELASLMAIGVANAREGPRTWSRRLLSASGGSYRYSALRGGSWSNC